MKIVFLARYLIFGGAERQMILLAKGLQERGHLVQVVVFYPNGPLEEELRKTGVPLRSLDKRGRWDIVGFFSRLIHLLREEKPDILHSYLSVPNLVTVMMKPLFHRIKIVWGIRSSNVDTGRYEWMARFSYWSECRLCRFVDLIIANSQAGFDYSVADGFPKEKMVVIPNGIDTERFRPDLMARRKVREEWKMTDREKLIGLVGRLDPKKDYETFLRAAALLMRERDDVRFVCVGDGDADYRQALHALSHQLGLADRVIWAGARADMPVVYNGLDMMTSASSYGEGFSNVVGEAMASGVPCVVTDNGDSAFIVGELGIVVPPADPHALAQGWRICLMKDKSDLARQGRSRIVETFSLNQLVKKSEQVLWPSAP